MTTSKEKIRSLFLTALMVMSVFSVGVGALAGSATAATNNAGNSDFAFDGDSAELPRVAYHGQTFDEVSINITNNNDSEVNGTVKYNFSENEGLSNGVTQASKDVTIPANETATVTFTDIAVPGILTNKDSTDTIYHGFSINPYSSTDLTVGTDEEGNINVRIDDINGDPINGATVELYRAGEWDGTASTSTPIRNVTLADDDNAHTFDSLAVGSNEADSVDYVIRAVKDEYESKTDQVSLFEPDRTGPTRTLTLQTGLEPNVFGVGAYDSDEERVTGNTSAVFANGEFDNQGQFAVFAQTQSSYEDTQPLHGDMEVTVNVRAANATDGSPLEFVTNQTDENTSRQISVTITPDSPTANIDGNDTTGVFSYETFNITAVNATEENVDPLRTEDLFAWSTDIADDDVTLASELLRQTDVGGHTPPAAQVTDQPLSGPLDDPAYDNYGSNSSDPEYFSRTPNGVEALLSDAFYFIEGEKASQHEVVDVTNREMFDDATIWAAYEDGPQSLDEIQDIQNDAGESFLVADNVEGQEGKYVIPGLVDNADFHIYVKADGYNIYNSSETDVYAQTLSESTGLPEDTLLADYTVSPWENRVWDFEGSGVAYDYTHHIREAALDFKLDVTVENETGQYNKVSEIPSGDDYGVHVEVEAAEEGSPDSEFEPIANQNVDLEIVETGDGNLGDLEQTTVSTNDNGVAMTNYTVGGALNGSVNISASTENVNGALYKTSDTEGVLDNNDSNQGQFDIFSTGTITGDVLDRNEDPIPSDGEEPIVTLDMLNTTSGEYENVLGPRPVSEGNSQYTFPNETEHAIRTGMQYRVTAEYQDETGFAVIDDLEPGTNTRDVVLEDVEVDNGVLSENNPFGDQNNNPVDRNTVIDRIVDWNNNGEIDGTSYTRDDIIDYIVNWNAA
ncbi:surface glycoprotein [Halorutilales archaeon Cl-col2-1]